MIHHDGVAGIPIAHDGDWYYMVNEIDAESVQELARNTLCRRTHIGRYLAGRQLKRLIRCEIDTAVDDTSVEYSQAYPLTVDEIAEEATKAL